MDKYHLLGIKMQKETKKKREEKTNKKNPKPFPPAKIPKSPYATCYLILPEREHLGFES